jgi:hypothetical protein
MQAAVLDGELFSGEGSEGIDAILEAARPCRQLHGRRAVDVLQLEGQDVMAEP